MKSLSQWLVKLLILVCVLATLIYFGPLAAVWMGLRIDGGYTEWSEWSQCSVSCGLDGAFETRVRTCANPAPNWLGYGCLTLGNDFERRQCLLTVSCPIDGGYSDWQSWSPCDKICEGGRRMRTRFCDNPMPMYGGKSCDGSATEFGSCNDAIKCPVHGGFSEWSPFQVCQETCKKLRFRTCNNPAPAYGGSNCEGLINEEQDCNDGLCKIDGAYADWVDSACSVTCGKGVIARKRTCTNPAPKNGGKGCKGPAEETVECIKPDCSSTAVQS